MSRLFVTTEKIKYITQEQEQNEEILTEKKKTCPDKWHK